MNPSSPYLYCHVLHCSTNIFKFNTFIIIHWMPSNHFTCTSLMFRTTLCWRSINAYDPYFALKPGLSHLPSPPSVRGFCSTCKTVSRRVCCSFQTLLMAGCRYFFWCEKKVLFEMDEQFIIWKALKAFDTEELAGGKNRCWHEDIPLWDATNIWLIVPSPFQLTNTANHFHLQHTSNCGEDGVCWPLAISANMKQSAKTSLKY